MPSRPVAFVASVLVLMAGCAPVAPSATKGGEASARREAPPRALSIVVRTEPFDLTDNASGRNRITLALFTANLGNLQGGAPAAVLADTLPVLGTETWNVLPDGRMETTYRLRSGLTWHDGAPLSTEDFVFTHRANALRVEWGLSTSALNLGEHRAISAVEATDDRTLTIRWRGTYLQAATPSMTALPPHILGPVVDQGREAFGSHPYWTTQYVGLGPFRLAGWEPGAYIEGTAFESFALGRPRIGAVRVTWSADENATLARVLAGGADIALDDAVGFPQGIILRRQWVAEGRGVLLLSPAWIRHIQVQFRPHVVNPASLLDVRVRKAIAHAIDRATLVDTLLEGLGIPADNIGFPTSSYYPQIQQAATKHPYDLRQTERWLQEAGFSRGADGVWSSPTAGRFSPQVLGIAEGHEGQETTTVVDMLRRAGIDAQLNLVPGAMIQRDDEMKSTFPALRTNYINPEDNMISRLVSAEVSGPENRWGAKNKAGYASEAHDRLYDQWRRTLDVAERNQIMVQLVKFYSEELPVMPMYIDVSVLAHTAALEGPVASSVDTTAYSNVHLWAWK